MVGVGNQHHPSFCCNFWALLAHCCHASLPSEYMMRYFLCVLLYIVRVCFVRRFTPLISSIDPAIPDAFGLPPVPLWWWSSTSGTTFRTLKFFTSVERNIGDRAKGGSGFWRKDLDEGHDQELQRELFASDRRVELPIEGFVRNWGYSFRWVVAQLQNDVSMYWNAQKNCMQPESRWFRSTKWLIH